jgi:uncharacterized protein (DUF433 family)
MKDLVQNVYDMHRAGFSIETIAQVLGCSIELIEETLELINKM